MGDALRVADVTDISRGRNGMIWFGTYSAVFGYDGRNFTIVSGLKCDSEAIPALKVSARG